MKKKKVKVYYKGTPSEIYHLYQNVTDVIYDKKEITLKINKNVKILRSAINHIEEE